MIPQQRCGRITHLAAGEIHLSYILHHFHKNFHKKICNFRFLPPENSKNSPSVNGTRPAAMKNAEKCASKRLEIQFFPEQPELFFDSSAKK
ncbi:MAG: hypothetical protein IK141_03350 [Clostridia bacterium]|nr:hypothetical protein [Clostridia bacterium]